MFVRQKCLAAVNRIAANGIEDVVHQRSRNARLENDGDLLGRHLASSQTAQGPLCRALANLLRGFKSCRVARDGIPVISFHGIPVARYRNSAHRTAAASITAHEPK